MDNTLLMTDIDYHRLSKISFNELKRAGVPEHVINEKEIPRVNRENGIRYLKDNGMADEVTEAMERIRNAMMEIEMENVASAKPFEGAVDVIGYLKGKGYKVGVLTKGSRRYATEALTVSGVIDMLDALVCRDDGDESEAKPSPMAMFRFAESIGVEPADILYIGDNEIDYLSATGAGADFIGVMTGYSEDRWRSIDENVRVTDTVADLLNIL